MSSRTLWLGSFALAFAALSVSDDAAAFCRMTTEGGAQVGEAACVEEGAPLEWRNPCLSYAIDSRGSQWMTNDDIEGAVDLAFKAWENADCGGSPPNLIFKPLQPSTCKRAEYNCAGNVNTIAFLNPWKDECSDPQEPGYDRNAFAVTIVWHDTRTGEILDADMMINDQLSSRFNAGGPYANCPETGCTGNDADLGSIVTHEAGHFIGIGHCNPEDPEDPEDPCVQATMFSRAERASVNKRSLAPDDIDAVCTIYPPAECDGGINDGNPCADDAGCPEGTCTGALDQSCNAAPKGGLQLDCETDADGKALPCNGTTCSTGGSGGCSVTTNPNDAPWGAILATLLALTFWRRRFDAKS